MTDHIDQPSRGALRAQRYRSRQRRSVRVVPIHLGQREIDALVHLGYLEPELRSDRGAMQSALEGYVTDRLLTDVASRLGC
jgi:hypothetical protein